MNKVDTARLMRQGSYDLQEILSETQEMVLVSEEILLLITSIGRQARFLSETAAEVLYARGMDEGLALVGHEAHILAEFCNEQSKDILNTLTEIKESIGNINASSNNALYNFGVSGQAAGTGQVNKAAKKIINELARTYECIFSETQRVLRLNV